MSFLKPHERNIIMDQPDLGPIKFAPHLTRRPLKPDDLLRLRDAGVETVMEFAPWDILEPERGRYDWSFADEIVERCRAAGMKALLMMPTRVVPWGPDEWYVWDRSGRVYRDHMPVNYVQTWGCFSPWNADAVAYQLGFIDRACRRYNSSDVMLIQCLSQEGESILPPAVPCVYDPAAVASYRAFVGDRRAEPNVNNAAGQAWMRETLLPVVLAHQAVYLSHPEREAWCAYHPVYWNWPASGVTDIAGYWRAIRDALNPAGMFHVFFAYFDNGFDGYLFPFAQDLIGMGVQVIAGSEWCDGLKRNTPRAIDHGLRALLTCPVHPYTDYTSVEPWMVEAVRDSARAFHLQHEKESIPA